MHFHLIFSPTSDGGAAVILASEDFVKKHGLENQAVEIIAMEMATDFPSTFEENSCMKMVRMCRCRLWYLSGSDSEAIGIPVI
jgi:hypothetical protein